MYNDITIFDSNKPDLLDEHLQGLGVPVLAPVPVSQHHRPQAPTQRCHQLAAHITRVYIDNSISMIILLADAVRGGQHPSGVHQHGAAPVADVPHDWVLQLQGHLTLE